jgi:hypothetical protein
MPAEEAVRQEAAEVVVSQVTVGSAVRRAILAAMAVLAAAVEKALRAGRSTDPIIRLVEQ